MKKLFSMSALSQLPIVSAHADLEITAIRNSAAPSSTKEHVADLFALVLQ